MGWPSGEGSRGRWRVHTRCVDMGLWVEAGLGAPCNRGTSLVVGEVSRLAGVDVYAGDGGATTSPMLTPSSVMGAPCSVRPVQEMTWVISTG